MEYGILGPLEVSDGCEGVTLLGGKPRALLAILLLHRNEVVSTDRLMEELWNGAPPVTAAKSLQLYVSQLRKLLPGERLLTRAPGYVLELGPEQLDADRFERLLAAGRRAIAADVREQASAQLRQALALWRGPALAEFSYETFAQSEITRLTDLRLAALEERIEVDLALGRHAELAVEIEALLAEYPLRERLYGQLMLSLYRCGRQAEALEAYASARHKLDSELGLEPSRALQDLQRRILAQDPTLEPPPRVEQPWETRIATLVPEPLRRRSVALLLAGGVLLGAGLVAAVVEIGKSGGHSARVPNALVRIDANDGRVIANTAVGETPTNVAVGAGGVWVVNADDQTISRADPKTGGIVKTFGTGQTPTDVAVGGGAAWVGNGTPTPQGAIGSVYTASVSRIDLRTNVVTRTVKLPLSHEPGPATEAVDQPTGVSRIAVGAGAVWAIDPDLTVSRLDPSTGTLVAVVPVVATNAIAAGREGVWVIGDGPVITRIDPGTNRAGESIRIEATGLAGIAVGAGSVWATDPADGLVWRVDPGPVPLARSLDAGVGITGISFASGALWATNFVDGTVLRIDPRTNSISARVRLAGTPEGVAAGNGSTWVSVAGDAPRGSLPQSACGPVEKGGEGAPDLLIASSLPLQGPQGAVTRAMADAIRFVFRRHGFRAGGFSVGYQDCDNATAQAGGEDFYKCASNSKAFAETARLVAVIGPYTSDCAKVAIPITNRAAAPLVLISPSNTLAGLTHHSPEAAHGEPGRYYPGGVRNYFRVVASDDLEGAGQALLAQKLGLERVFVLSTGQTAYGRVIGNAFRRTARRLGVRSAGSGTWDPRASGYAALAGVIRRSRADGVLLADYDLNGGALIRDLRARLGSRVVFITGDGFLPISNFVSTAGAAADGVYVTYPGVLDEDLGASGKRFRRDFAAAQPGGAVPSGTYIPEAAEAAELILKAIARSDGTRASILKELRSLDVGNGILGSFRFDRNGDMTPALVTVVRINGRAPDRNHLTGDFRQSVPDRLVRVPTALLAAPATSS